MINYHLLFDANEEVKTTFIQMYDSYHGSSYPPTDGWDTLGFICNLFNVPLRTVQLQILSRKQALLEILVYGDKHGYQWSDVKEAISQYSGSNPFGKHMATALGALSKTDGDRGLLTLLLEMSPLEAFATFIGASNKTLDATKERVVEMIMEDMSCRLLRTALFLFDSKSALRHFFDVCGYVAQTNFEMAEKSAALIEIKQGTIGNEEWIKTVLEETLDKIIDWWQKKSPTRMEKLIKILKGKNTGEKV